MLWWNGFILKYVLPRFLCYCWKSCNIIKVQKQPSRGVLRERCSESMPQIYRRTPMQKCDFRIKLQSKGASESFNIFTIKKLHTSSEMLSFLPRWDCCWKCEFDTDLKVENYSQWWTTIIIKNKVFIKKYTSKYWN